jgi:hypothetical protein
MDKWTVEEWVLEQVDENLEQNTALDDPPGQSLPTELDAQSTQ